jgi:hypothetical protein
VLLWTLFSLFMQLFLNLHLPQLCCHDYLGLRPSQEMMFHHIHNINSCLLSKRIPCLFLVSCHTRSENIGPIHVVTSLICLYHTSVSTIFFDQSSAIVGQTIFGMLRSHSYHEGSQVRYCSLGWEHLEGSILTKF